MSGKYIVVFKSSASKEDIKKYTDGVSENGGSVTNRYDSSSMKGFSATIPDSYLTTLKSLQGSVVDYVEPDGPVSTQ